MSGVNLETREASFTTHYSDMRDKLGRMDAWKVVQNEKLGRDTRTYKHARLHLLREISDIEHRLCAWRATKLSADHFPDFTCSEEQKRQYQRQHKIQHVAAMVAFVAGAIWATLGTMAVAVGAAIVDGGGVAAPWLVRAIPVGLVLSCASFAIASLFSDTKAGREKRVACGENFHHFVRRYVSVHDDGEIFYPQEADLFDPNLHSIYRSYKAAIVALPQG